MRFCFAALAFFFFVLAGAPSAEAHTYHTSLTRIDLNPSSKTLEISIQLFNHDVQPMLERRLKKRIDLAKSPEVDGELLRYLTENFGVRAKDGSEALPKWIGKEFENDVVHVYLEIPFDGRLEGATVRNSIFFESFPEQTNHVIVRFEGKRSDLVFKSGRKTLEIRTSKKNLRGR